MYSLLGVLLLPAIVSSIIWSKCPLEIPDGHMSMFHGDKCYYFITTERSNSKSISHCSKHGGNIVQITNSYLQNVIINKIRDLGWSKNGIWIGLKMKDNDFYWNDGTSLSYSNWGSGHPKYGVLNMGRQCVIMKRRDGYRWHQKLCTGFISSYRSICESDLFLTSTTTTSTTTTTSPTTTTTTTAPAAVVEVTESAIGLQEQAEIARGNRNLTFIVSKQSGSFHSMSSSQEDTQRSSLSLILIVIGSLALLLLIIVGLLFKNRELVMKLRGNYDDYESADTDDIECVKTKELDDDTVVIIPVKKATASLPPTTPSGGERVENIYIGDVQVRRLPELPEYALKEKLDQEKEEKEDEEEELAKLKSGVDCSTEEIYFSLD